MKHSLHLSSCHLSLCALPFFLTERVWNRGWDRCCCKWRNQQISASYRSSNTKLTALIDFLTSKLKSFKIKGCSWRALSVLHWVLMQVEGEMHSVEECTGVPCFCKQGCSVEDVWEHCTSCSLIPDTLATSVQAEKYRSVLLELFWSYLGSTIQAITFYNTQWVDGRNPTATSTQPWDNKLGNVHFLSAKQFKIKI